MKLVRETSPYLRKSSSVSRMMLDVIIALMPLLIYACVVFSLRVLLVTFVSVAVMLLSELLFCKICKKKITRNNFLAPIISGMIYAFLLPSTISIYIVVVGALVGIIIGKLVFGGLGSNVVNPAAFGRCFVGICFGSSFTYSNLVTSATALGDLKTSGLASYALVLENYSLCNLFLGNIPGSIGEVCKLLIIVGAIYLFVRKSADIRTFIGFIGTFVLLSLVAAIAMNVDVIEFTLFNLFTGGVLFGAVYMITDPVTTPITQRGRVLFGVLVAGTTLMIRFFGAYPEGMAFSIILFNMCVPLIDHHSISANKFTLKYSLATAGIIIFFALTIILAL